MLECNANFVNLLPLMIFFFTVGSLFQEYCRGDLSITNMVDMINERVRYHKIF